MSGLTETPTAQWFDNKGLVIEGNGAVSTGGQSILTFSPLKTSHAGSYRCEGSVTSPALEQPLVINSTWELTVRSKSHTSASSHSTSSPSRNPGYASEVTQISLLHITCCILSTIAVPDPSITLTRTDVNMKLYARDIVNFICQVQIQESVDTSVNVSLTWVQEFHKQQPEFLNTEYILIDSTHETTPFVATRNMTIGNLSSLNRRITCRIVVRPSEEGYISMSGESSQSDSLEVTGDCPYSI